MCSADLLIIKTLRGQKGGVPEAIKHHSVKQKREYFAELIQKFPFRMIQETTAITEQSSYFLIPGSRKPSCDQPASAQLAGWCESRVTFSCTCAADQD